MTRLLLLLMLLASAPAQAAQGWIERQLERLTGGAVHVEGLSGTTTAFRATLLELRDADGVWASASDIAIDWTPAALLRRRLDIARLAIGHFALRRLPGGGGGGGAPAVPLAVAIDALAIERLDIPAQLATHDLTLALTGHLAIDRAATAKLDLTAVAPAGSYSLAGTLSPTGADATFALNEPEDGLLAGMAGLGKLALSGGLRGPWTALAVQAEATAGKQHATVAGRADAPARSASLDLAADAGPFTAGIAWRKARLAAHIAGPLAAPGFSATASAETPYGTLALRADAPSPTAIALDLTAPGLTARATLDAFARTLNLTALRAVLRGQTIGLAAPARIAFADGVVLDRLRLTGAGAELTIAGRAAPTPDLTATLRGLKAGLFADAEGSFAADARLTGNAGTLRLTGTGLRLRAGPAASLPAGRLELTATRAGPAARIAANLAAGPARASLAGTVPLGAGSLDLRGEAALPLALLDPLIAAGGRRVRGDLTVTGTVTGPLAAPVPSADLRIAGATVEDAAAGLRLTGLDAAATLRGDLLRLDRLTARAGPGRIEASGTALRDGALALHISAHNARPIATDLATATLDADLDLTGTAPDALTLAGRIALQQVDIRLPERMPVRLPTLNVRARGARRPAAPPPAPGLGLDLAISVPGRVNIRGRGLDAELGGDVQVRGTAGAPLAEGALALRRGSFTVAGQSLTLATGKIGLDGSVPPDPTLDFTATTRAGSTTATLTIGGTASAPKITLSSDPALPQDEILSALLLGRSTSQLGPADLAQIAAAFAQLSDIGSGFDPLETIRARLGLDRLGIGSSSTGDPRLEAGRSIARGVYLGVKQGTTAASSQGTVQIDLGHGLKLQADLGAPSAKPDPGERTGSGVGLVWEYEW